MLTITVEPEQPRVGDLITVRYRVANLGIPAYTITLTPGGEIRAEYASPYITQPAPFENTLVEVVDSSAASGGTLQLRALAAGTLTISVSASGEARTRMLDQQGTPQTALYWTNASSSAIIIIGE